MRYRKGDKVSVTVRRPHPVANPPAIGEFVAYVEQYSDLDDGYVTVYPDQDGNNLDEMCDLLGFEGSMSWTEIRGCRDNPWEDVPLSDVALISRAGLTETDEQIVANLQTAYDCVERARGMMLDDERGSDIHSDVPSILRDYEERLADFIDSYQVLAS